MKVAYIAEDGTMFDTEKKCLDYENAPVIYCIKNTVNEYDERITRFCSSIEEAKRELACCNDWFDKPGTGRIYKVRLNTNKTPIFEMVCSGLNFWED